MADKADMHPIIAMTVDDDFAAYETLAAQNMQRGDFYDADGLRERIETGYVAAWWIKNNDGMPVAWCGMNINHRDWPGANNFLGIVVSPSHRRGNYALRMVRHILAQSHDKPLMAHIRPGIATEAWVKPLGFALVGYKDPWNVYRREARHG